MALFDRIKYDGPSGGHPWLVYKYPSEEFTLGSQLIVNQSQEALFLKGGEALDLFGPGTHTLVTGNLPLLNKLVNLPFGGQTPFTAEIYYLNKTSRLDMRWGTSVPFPVEDPKYGNLISVRAFGQYGITVLDSRLFVSQLIGAMNGGHVTDYEIVTRYFDGIINSKIKEIVAFYMIEKKISFLEITSHIGDLSRICKEAINEEFARFGVEILNFYVESVNVPKEDTEQLKILKEKKAELNILGEDYYRRRSFDVLEKLADNPSSGGMANAAMGLGMGLGAGAAAGGAFANIASNLNAAAPTNSTSNNVSQGQTICPKCGEHNQSGMKFCGSCGDKLQVTVSCTKCGSQVPAGMKFCGECGQAVGNKKCNQCGAESAPTSSFCGNCGRKH
ncbi:SPFH domain-containing protein [Paenibacillus andongensis]|uniref:SPFH domain-containing protein n=1 Tax=Paenibacillus andongensis TaxID=2975482 RepID=UPI0021BAA442|nr:SPFH domain-containing protein [Paenibacillus andongensis]